MKQGFLLSVFLFLALSPLTASGNPPIGVSLHSTEQKKSYDGSMYCNLFFSLHNNSAPGTIERIDIGVEIYDDRGRKVDLNLMSNKIQNKGDGFLANRTPIRIGETMLRTEEVWAEEECQYLGKWAIKTNDIENSDCSIRMLPESVDCSTLVGPQLVK